MEYSTTTTEVIMELLMMLSFIPEEDKSVKNSRKAHHCFQAIFKVKFCVNPFFMSIFSLSHSFCGLEIYHRHVLIQSRKRHGYFQNNSIY